LNIVRLITIYKSDFYAEFIYLLAMFIQIHKLCHGCNSQIFKIMVGGKGREERLIPTKM
jgi:hypothetical protein